MSIIDIVSLWIAVSAYILYFVDKRPNIQISSKDYVDMDIKLGDKNSLSSKSNKSNMSIFDEMYFSNLDFDVHNMGQTGITDLTVSFGLCTPNKSKLDLYVEGLSAFLVSENIPFEFKPLIDNKPNSNRISYLTLSVGDYTLKDSYVSYRNYDNIFRYTSILAGEKVSINVPSYFVILWQLYLLYDFKQTDQDYDDKIRLRKMSEVLLPYVTLRYTDYQNGNVVETFIFDLNGTAYDDFGSAKSLSLSRTGLEYSFDRLQLKPSLICKKEPLFKYGWRYLLTKVYSSINMVLFKYSDDWVNITPRFKMCSSVYICLNEFRYLLSYYLNGDGLLIYESSINVNKNDCKFKRLFKKMYFKLIDKYNANKIKKIKKREWSRMDRFLQQ